MSIDSLEFAVILGIFAVQLFSAKLQFTHRLY
jgi:hypothetical protein